MTALSPPPVRENVMNSAEPASRWRRLIPRSRRGKTAIAGGVAVLLVAGVLGATYETSPGGALWGAEKTVFPEHAQDVALAAVVNDLKKAQDILGSGQQPTPDQLSDARTSLNQAKQDLDYLSPSPQRTSLQNLYLQLTQQLLQYTPASVQQLPALPAPPPASSAADPTNPPQTPDAAPTWGYPISDDAGSVAPDDFVSPPPDVPDAPAADWPQPYAPPLTPNLEDLGYYDPSWGQLYGYDPTDWYNYDLSGYNQYGFDFLGFDRWGYDRWGYDRWGYDRWGYNWAGCNWAGYNRNGWDRDGRNEWGQRRDHPGDPRNQDWYNRHHPYEQYYQWKFRHDDPAYHRTQWDHAHGFNPNQYQNWNMSRDWHHPRNRDWAPLAAESTTKANTHASSPVVNLNASLAQFISNDKTTSKSGPLMKDLADKSTRDFTRELNPRVTVPIWSQPPSALGKRPATSTASHQTSFAPPALTAPAPTAPPSKVSPGFTAPKLSPVPVYTPPKVAQPQRKPERTPANIAPGRGPNRSSGPVTIPPKTGSPNPAVAPPAEPIPVTPPNPAAAPPREHSAPQTNPVPQAPESEPRGRRPATPTQQAPPQRRAAPEPPAQDAPAPKTQAPAPAAPVRQAPVHQTPPPQARDVAPERPVRQAPPVHEAPHPAPRSAPEPRQGRAPRAPKCSIPMC